MSGLFARTKPAGRDGVRYARSKHMGDTLSASVIFGGSRVSTDRSFHLLRPASSWAIRRATSLAGRPGRRTDHEQRATSVLHPRCTELTALGVTHCNPWYWA